MNIKAPYPAHRADRVRIWPPAGNGAIVNLGSINGLIGMAGSALYSATKAAIHSLTKS